MARFQGILVSRNGKEHTCLTPLHGIVKLNGWHLGITVEASETADGSDAFAIYATGGSSHPSAGKLLGTVTYSPATGPVLTPPAEAVA